MDAMQHLVIDLAAGTESRVDLSPAEVADRERLAMIDAERIAAEDALRADIAARRASLVKDLGKVKDPHALRVLELVLLRLGESIR